MMNISNRETFQVSYNSGVQFGKSRPPTSAKLVAVVSWGWAPAHDRTERYIICTDRKRRGWMLWAIAYNEFDAKLMYANLAYGKPLAGFPATVAAKELLSAAWQGLREGYGEDLRGAYVDEEGLLTKEDIEEIELKVFGDLNPTPETIVERHQWSDERWHCLFRGSLRDACIKYGIELKTALQDLKYGSTVHTAEGNIDLTKAGRA